MIASRPAAVRAIVAGAAQVSYGLVRGTAPPGTARIVVRVDGALLGATAAARPPAFAVDLDLPLAS